MAWALPTGEAFTSRRRVGVRRTQRHREGRLRGRLDNGAPKGAELIASKWITTRKVPQIAFKSDWTKHAKAAPFKRNDAMLELLPIGVMHFPGTGIQDNLADKAKRLGIAVWKFGGA